MSRKSIVQKVQQGFRSLREPWEWLDFGRLLPGGGGVFLGLAGVAVAGYLLPGWVRLLLVVLGLLIVFNLRPEVESPASTAIRPFAVVAVLWLGLAWGLGLLNPWIWPATLALLLIGMQRWLAYRVLSEEGAVAPPEQEPERAAPPPPEPVPQTALERLDELLREAPVEGYPFGYYVAAMDGHMGRNTVRKYLDMRGIKLGHGRYRAGAAPLVERMP